MNVENMKIKDLVPYEGNAKKHDETQIKNVMESIKQFGFAQPIVVDKDNVIIIGHCRLIAAKRLHMEDVPVVRMDDLNKDEVQKLRLLDNKLNESDWDFELLAEQVPELDFSGFDIDWGIPDMSEPDEVEHVTLTDAFIVPPFSILDTRQGYWQDRKRQWISLGIQSEKGRNENLTNASDLPAYLGNGMNGIAVQTSIFDPVMCEIAYKWFCTDGGKIYDCFAGGSVRGIVAEKLGYHYTGIDLRKEQVEANYENASDLDLSPVWYCDDSLNADKYLEDESVDMIFSCPPYFDLEVYSDLPNDISNMDYDNFAVTYKKIIDIACRKLKKDRFAVFVVGDIRDKSGAYRNFIDLTKKCFLDNGLIVLNELILVESIGTAAVRAKKQFTTGRKVIKTHQNILVFYKGNIKNIKNNFKQIEVGDISGDADDE